MFQDMNDDELSVEIIKLSRQHPEPKNTIRYIQSIFETRYAQELASNNPNYRRVENLESMIESIDRAYLQDYTEYGTMKWRGKHPWEPLRKEDTAE